MANQFLNSGASRSELLAALMDKQNRRYSQQQDPSSIGEALTRTGTRLVDAFSQKKLVDDELERRQKQQGVDRKAYQTALSGIGVGGVTGNEMNFPNPTGQITNKANISGMPNTSVSTQELPSGTLVEAIVGGSDQAYGQAMNTEGLSNQAFANLYNKRDAAQTARDTQARAERNKTTQRVVRNDNGVPIATETTDFYGNIIDYKVIDARDDGRKPTQREQDIALMEKQGVPKKIAVGIATGQYKLNRNELDGTIQVVDLSNGSILFDGRGGDQADLPPVGVDGLVVEGGVTTDPKKLVVGNGDTNIFGVEGSLKGVANFVADLFDQELPFNEISVLSKKLDNLNTTALQLASSGVDGKPNVFFQKEIKRLLPVSNNPLSGRGKASSQMVTFISALTNEKNRLKNDLKTLRLKPETQDTMTTKISELESLANQYQSVLTNVKPRNEKRPNIEEFYRNEI